MPYDTLPPNSTLNDRWSRMIIRADAASLVTYWSVWVPFAAISGLLNLGMILLICCKRRLRRKAFNQYVLSLALPDCLFSSACAFTCASNSMNGEWFGGSLQCDVQSAYVIFGFSASIWMNAVVARQIYFMAFSAAQMIVYVPPSTKQVLRQVLAVYAFSMVLAILPTTSFFPVRSNAIQGLACLPLESDITSTVVMWCAFMPLLLVAPILAVGFYFWGCYRLLLRDQDMKEARSLFIIFGKMFAALLLLWGPTGVLIWMVGGDAPSVVNWIGGTVSHLQGTISAILYLEKPDLRSALKEVFTSIRSSPAQQDGVQTQSDAKRTHQGGQAGDTEAIAKLRSDALRTMRETERVAMQVISYFDFLSHGSIPRSSDKLQRPLADEDISVFISHRWWGTGASARGWQGHVDNEHNYKYMILCRALKSLIELHEIPVDRLVIWVDFACIEQDIPELTIAGVESLLSYACRSQYILIPVFPEPKASIAFKSAHHPMDLLDYGERAWCRLESYVFACLGEIAGKPVSCYAFGVLLDCKEDAEFDEELKTTGVRRAFCFQKQHAEKLRSLMDRSGASFDQAQMPSSGKLTVESDRSVVRSTEQMIQGIYCEYTIRKGVTLQLDEAQSRALQLEAKQLYCTHVPLLIKELSNREHVRLRRLSLASNQLRWTGFVELLQAFGCKPESCLEELDLRDNRIGELWELENVTGDLCFFNPDLMAQFVSSLSGAPCSLRSLHLADNRLAENAVDIVRVFRGLEELDLSSNAIGSSGARAMASALEAELAGDASGSQKTRTNLQRIDLASNDIPDSEAQRLLNVASDLSLRLGLAGNQVSKKSFGKAVLLDANALL